ncbi:MAG: 2-C-methyl-D-erythritol 4-phosphate cytidylyltransferase [Chitinophagaceae bacterium]|nr:2-C-methyl-D-erythritol 4-phosphate cytidylyltransferase [Chitinophagaceae bacterium]
MQATPIYVVIVAGGQGTRMGMALPKQFLPLAGKPILYHTIVAFLNALPDAIIKVVLPAADVSKMQMVLQHFEERISLELVAGGATRYDSVKNGLKNIPTDALILVHDGVRPFVDKETILRCVATASITGNAVPAIAVSDSVRVLSAMGNSPINREMLRAIQTPQCFQGAVLLPAFEQPYQPKFTDEATVVESLDHKINLVEGHKNNIKITTPEDLALAEILIKIINQTPSF